MRALNANAYFSSTLAPAFSSWALTFSASSLDTPSLTFFGAPSTKSLASLRPRPVSARTSLMTSIFFSPAPISTTVNSVFSSTGAAAAPPPTHRQPPPHPPTPDLGGGAGGAPRSPGGPHQFIHKFRQISHFFQSF